MISAVVLAKNEEKNIEECLKSLKWCDEIIIVDDYSEDGTLKKVQSSKFKVQNDSPRGEAGKSKLKIFKRRLDNDFAGQRNFGLEKASGDWVLFVDADERVNGQLRSEIGWRVTRYGLRVNGFNLK